MIAWISYIGSFVGFSTGIFVVYDRLLAGRPMLALKRAGSREEGHSQVNLLVRNPSSEDMLVEVMAASGNGSPTIHLGCGPDSPAAPFEVLVASKEDRVFPLRFPPEHDRANAASRVGFQVRWKRLRSTWLPQRPRSLRTTSGDLRELERAL